LSPYQLDDLPVTSIPNAVVLDDPTLVQAHLRDDGTVQRSLDGAFVGRLDTTIVKCFSRLAEQTDVGIQLMLKAVPHLSPGQKESKVVAHVAAILYGKEDVADCVGSFLDHLELYLQDPFLCDRNVPYRNPHCLPSLFEELRMTFDLAEPGAAAGAALSLPDHLRALETTDEFPEWAQKPSALRAHVELQK
jgi:hypothetical protein